ncbi:MAG: amidohydrolase family protein, partial [Defluviitaleaceae bacterium]|nr:amidohydrolase family protein [Defluviitaleaceae bacterium]
PPLRSPKDIEAIKTGLSDGTIDAIATDHAPHHAEEKAKDFSAAPFGIVGLETALPLSLALVREGVITPNQLVRLMSLAPAEILGLERGHLSVGAVADITIIDPDAKHTINPENFASKGRNTPFAGWEMQGEVVATIVEGRIVYDNRQID